MAVLTQFLSATPKKNIDINTCEEARLLEHYRSLANDIEQTLKVRITDKCDIGKVFIEKENSAILNMWKTYHFLPKKFANSIVQNTSDSFDDDMFDNMLDAFDEGSTRRHTGLKSLFRLSDYPTVSLGNLQNLAEKLSFVIIPVQYTDLPKVFASYKALSSNYSNSLYNLYNEFKKIIHACEEYNGEQNFYILCPLSLYDVWKEIECESVFPKFFPSSLASLSVTLGLLIPAQRNLYKICQTNDSNIRNLTIDMQNNIKAINKTISQLEEQVSWITKCVANMQIALQSQAQEIKDLKLAQAQLEQKLYCLLDPIVFTVDKDVDISSFDSADALARIGMCFGLDIPENIFQNTKLPILNHDAFTGVTHAFSHEKYNKNWW